MFTCAFLLFLDGSMHLYKRVCLSVRPSVHHASSKNPRKHLFLVAYDIRINGRTSRNLHTHLHTRTRMHLDAPVDEINTITESRWRAIAKHTYTNAPAHTHTHMHTHVHTHTYTYTHTQSTHAHLHARTHTHALPTHKQVFEITEKRQPVAYDEQQENRHKYTYTKVPPKLPR